MTTNIYSRLEEIHRRPGPFEHGSPADLWTDPYISARMLDHHLDPSSDVSSRNAAFIERSAAWIVDRFGLGPGRRVVDFGCGPGLYTSRFAAAGADTTGVDFSERSLAHARGEARRHGLSINYVCGSYLDFESDERFDLVTLIMCDFCALSPEKRGRLLQVFTRHLAPGGAVLLDVYSLGAFEARREQATCARNLMGGFWAPGPYFGFHNTFKYEAEKVVLDKYTILEETRGRTVYNWLQYFSPETLEAELRGRGLEVEEVLGDVAGSPMDPEAHEFAVLARRPEGPGGGAARPREGDGVDSAESSG